MCFFLQQACEIIDRIRARACHLFHRLFQKKTSETKFRAEWIWRRVAQLDFYDSTNFETFYARDYEKNEYEGIRLNYLTEKESFFCRIFCENLDTME